MNATLRITLLGSPIVEIGGQPVNSFVSNKARALFYYLASNPHQHERNKLATLLWGNSPKAKRNLRDLIYNLRQVFEPYLIITRTEVGLNRTADIEIDYEQFIHLLEQRTKDIEEWQTLLSLYRGEFLQGFWLDEQNEFDEWQRLTNEQVELRFTNALETAVGYFFGQQDFENTIRFSTQLLIREPWNEVGHQKLMLAYALQGLRNKALTQYNIYTQALSNEIGAEPSWEMVDYHQQILEGSVDLLLAEQPRHNLPARVTPLIGRNEVLAQALQHIDADNGRLLTIGGPGGVGKTRLALDVAWYFADHNRFSDGVFWVNLIDVVPTNLHLSHRAVIQAIMEALHMPVSSFDLETQLYDILRDKNTLLVLDNFEHLQTASRWVAQLMRHLPKLSLIITSRRWLNISGEFCLSLPGLSYFENMEASGMDTPAAQLFRRQVRALDLPDQFDAESQTAIQQICQLVDGLPLGIVLAARWARLLSPQQIAQQMSKSLHFLQDSAVDAPERHNSLEAVFNYSWSLLEQDARQALSRLSLFRGGFDLSAAEAVDVSLNTLFLLVDCSLVTHTSAANTKRFDIPVSIREFAKHKLDQKEEEETHHKHSLFYLTLLERYLPQLKHYNKIGILAYLDRDIENIRLAWSWAIKTETLRAEVVEALFLYFDMKSQFRDGYNAFDQNTAGLTDRRLSGMLLARSGWFSFHLGHVPRAKYLLNQALVIAQELNNDDDATFALNYLAAIHFHSNQLSEAHEFALQALIYGETLADPYLLAIVHNILGDIGFRQAQYDNAMRHSQKSLALIQSSGGNLWSKTFSLTNLGRIAKAQRKYDEAASFFRQSLAIREEMGDLRGIALCYQYLGETAIENKESQTARRYLYLAQSLLQQIGSMREASSILINLGNLAYQDGEFTDATHYFGRALVWANGFEQNLHLQQALIGFTRVWRTSNPELVQEIETYFEQTQQVSLNPHAFGSTASHSKSPPADIQPLDLLISKVLTYADV